MKQPVVLVAASGLAREVAAAIEAAGSHHVVGVLDDNAALHGTDCAGTIVTGTVDAAVGLDGVQFVLCAGSGGARRRIAERLAVKGIGSSRYATIIHPSAAVPSSSNVGAGSVLLAHVTLTADVTVGQHVVVMPQAVLTHDAVVADFATLCAGVALGGNVQVGSGAYLGMSSSVRQGLRLGQDATLGMGSVLLQDLPAGQTWVGVPAHPMAVRPVAALANVHEIHGRLTAFLASERHDAR